MVLYVSVFVLSVLNSIAYVYSLHLVALFCLIIIVFGMIFPTGTGYISPEEFLDLVRCKVQEDEDEKELKTMFHILDKEKRGEVYDRSQL